MRKRRVAVHEVLADGQTIAPCVVEMVCPQSSSCPSKNQQPSEDGIVLDGEVVAYYPLTEELAMTEWLGGTIKIVPSSKGDVLLAIWDGNK